MKKSRWVRLNDEGFVQVFEHSITGDIKCIYPKAPKWAQRAAYKIWKDSQKSGMPTEKGVREIVKGLWAKIISEESKNKGE